MSITIERKKGVQMIRMASDTVTESDADSVKAVIELSLSVGIKKVILTIMEKMLADHTLLSGLLLNCEKLIRRKSGAFSLVITTGKGGDGMFRRNDSRFGIPVFGSEDDAIKEMLATLPPPPSAIGS